MRNRPATLEQWIQHVHQSFAAAVDDALAAYVALGADVGDLQVRHEAVSSWPVTVALEVGAAVREPVVVARAAVEYRDSLETVVSLVLDGEMRARVRTESRVRP